MELRQLGNLVDILGGDHFDPQNLWDGEVVFRTPDGNLNMVHSLSWSAGEQRWILSADIPDEGDWG